MSRNMKILLTMFLLAFALGQEKMCQHLGYGQAMSHNNQATETPKKEPIAKKPVTIEKPTESYKPKYDSIYHWDEQVKTWSAIGTKDNLETILADKSLSEYPLTKVNEVKWKVLMNIHYELKYFESLGSDLYAPIFSDEIKKLDGKEVIIQGFVIPFDEEGKLLALSYNPYASCFFCGNASAASVISLYPKNKKRVYKTDDFKKFKGKLILNYDDPDNFYYILKNAIEV